MKRGLVIGKFYPFHLGHAHLIETAKKQVDNLTILVCDRSDQIFSGEIRAAWIQEKFPDVSVLVIRDIGHDDDSEMWARYTISFLGYAPDIVFTSESYGDAYAKYMGARHFMVDISRKSVPISGTKIRKDPYGHWEFLSSPVRAQLARRVAIVGADSTGKTTIAKDLAKHFSTPWVPEFGRMYAEGRIFVTKEWEGEEFSYIARERDRLEDFYARRANKILFCDTNSWATCFWCGRYVGRGKNESCERAKKRKYDLIFLTDTDVPFVQDEIRDGKKIRKKMQRELMRFLDSENASYVLLSGSYEERMKKAIFSCEQLLQSVSDIFLSFPRQNAIDTQK